MVHPARVGEGSLKVVPVSALVRVDLGIAGDVFLDQGDAVDLALGDEG